jgi:hypothetical protein
MALCIIDFIGGNGLLGQVGGRGPCSWPIKIDNESLMYKIKTLGNERTRLQVLANRNAPVIIVLSQ